MNVTERLTEQELSTLTQHQPESHEPLSALEIEALGLTDNEVAISLRTPYYALECRRRLRQMYETATKAAKPEPFVPTVKYCTPGEARNIALEEAKAASLTLTRVIPNTVGNFVKEYVTKTMGDTGAEDRQLISDLKSRVQELETKTSGMAHADSVATHSERLQEVTTRAAKAAQRVSGHENTLSSLVRQIGEMRLEIAELKKR